MPFKETCVLDETMRFVVACAEGEESMAALCRAFGISRQWGYELMRRYRLEGVAGLEPRSRAPHRPGQAMVSEIADAIIALRCAHPSWGPKKLRAVLVRRAPARPGRPKAMGNKPGKLSTMYPVCSVNNVSGCSSVASGWGV